MREGVTGYVFGDLDTFVVRGIYSGYWRLNRSLLRERCVDTM